VDVWRCVVRAGGPGGVLGSVRGPVDGNGRAWLVRRSNFFRKTIDSFGPLWESGLAHGRENQQQHRGL